MSPDREKGNRAKVQAHASEQLLPAKKRSRSRTELIRVYKRFLKLEEYRIRMAHKAGEGGIEICQRRSSLLDVVLVNLFETALLEENGGKRQVAHIAMVATGGYGRGLLNPSSDIDLHFIVGSASLPKSTQDFIEEILYMLWDVGFKVGHATRTLKQTLQQASADNQTKSSLIEARFLWGKQALFDSLQASFRKSCIDRKEADYLKIRVDDIRTRRKKWFNTVFLQEPNVKQSAGGLRDYQNMIWITWVKRNTLDLQVLVEEGYLAERSFNELQRAYDFLLRVRNELHYEYGRGNDLLTLQMQGVVAKNFAYPQHTILRKIEAFMRDYYTHTRALLHHVNAVLDAFQIEVEEEEREGFRGLFSLKNAREEHFDGFFSRESRIFPEHDEIFFQDPGRIMRVFQHTQLRYLRFSPELVQLFTAQLLKVDQEFRYHADHRAVFESILSRKGEVGPTLRRMHRLDFLGRYLPEFGKLTCLVQHEFFHRYTADEHTLRCIDEMDGLLDTDHQSLGLLQKLFRDFPEPFILYLALILHDTGRAENVRRHEDGSAMLASQVAKRLQIKSDRRRLLMFLVDHHLTFWRTATTKNIDDPEVVIEFAKITRSQLHLDALLIFTYADSKGTNEEAWSSWKESLMLRLYRHTTGYFEDQQAFHSRFSRPLAEVRKEVDRLLPETFAAETKAHFAYMPEHYFYRPDSEAIARHIRMVKEHRDLLESSGEACVTPSITWVEHPNRGTSELLVCSEERELLLASIAAALAAQNLTVMRADIFTRVDGLVLDIFHVRTTNFEPVRSKRILRQFEADLAKTCQPTESLFGDLLQRASGHVRTRKVGLVGFPQRVYVQTNDPKVTTVEVQAQDRIGLLFDLFFTLRTLDLEVVQARIHTEKGAALDSFSILDERHEPLKDAVKLQAVQSALEDAIGIEHEAAHQSPPLS
ncbi:MAG: [protein-PII] uridylyltransferase [Verrucomicrobiota bacterium]